MQSKKLKVLVLGYGAREHALAWKIARSPRVGRIFVAPGNVGTAEIATNVPISDEDVAEAILWLVAGARTTTGELLMLDSGMHLGRAAPAPPAPD